MKICMLSTFPPRRCGIADYTADLSSALIHRGIEVHALTYEEQLAPSYEEVTPDIKVHRVLKGNPFVSLGCWRKIKEISPDVIHIQSSTWLHNRFVYFLVLLNSPGVPLVTTIHDTSPTSFRLLPITPFLKLLYGKSDRFLVHSSVVRNMLMKHHGISPDDIAIIPHGVDTLKFQPRSPNSDVRRKLKIEDEQFLLLFLGFVLPWKGVIDLIEALPLVLSKAPHCKLVIGGGLPSKTSRYSLLLKSEANYPALIKRAVASLHLEDHVIFTGYIPEQDVPEYLAAADAVVFPHRSCSQSGMMHKAMAAGKAIVATATGGFLDTIEDGESGLLVPPFNPRALSQVIVRLIKDEKLRASLGVKARNKAKAELSWRRAAEETIEAYKSVLATG